MAATPPDQDIRPLPGSPFLNVLSLGSHLELGACARFVNIDFSNLRGGITATPDAAEALEALATGLIVMDAGGRISFANGAAVELFAPVPPVALGLRALMALCGATNCEDLLSQVDAGIQGTPVRIGLSGGRRLECHARFSPRGTTLTLIDVTRYVQAAERAERDPLTGLPNRAFLDDRLAELLARSRREASALAVMCLDLDRFKAVNDTLGHPVGDALLALVGQRLQSALRQGDVLARLGGDEFAIVQTAVPQPRGAEALAKRLVDLIGRTYLVDGHMLNIGASVGVALAPTDADDAATLLKHADLALYRAKSEGRGRFAFFHASMDAEMQARRSMEIDLRKALALKQFALAYQPQIELSTNTVVGFEALLRWHTEERGVVSPATFIPLAEEVGLINAIGAWVLRTACREAASWSRPVSVAVNVSAVQLRNADLLQAVTSALAHSGLDPRRLELEITESALLENTQHVLQQLHAVKQLGVRISMDDFGTGYSSLAYLQKFPFDKIKIDQSFVRNANNASDCSAIVRAVSALGASLGMKTTAEGVETDEQLARMRAEGCSEVQGYLTGRPLTPAAAAALLAQPRCP